MDNSVEPILMEENEDLQNLRTRLDYFFMDPLKKWKLKKKRPWKLLVQVVKIFIFTAQLVVFGSDMSKFVSYKDEMQLTFKQLLLKDYDPSNEAAPYPGPETPYAIYKQSEYYDFINYAIANYGNLYKISIGPFAYQTNDNYTVSPIDFCVTNYVQADFDTSHNSYNYSLYTLTECKTIRGYANASEEKWHNFDIRQNYQRPINFATLITTSIKLPIRSLLIEEILSGGAQIICFNVDIHILLDNQNRDGEMKIELSGVPKTAYCNGRVSDANHGLFQRRLLNFIVMFFCIVSFALCMRSLVRSYKLMEYTRLVLLFHGRRLIWQEKLEFVDPWLVLIVINDLMIASATLILSFYDDKLLETNNYTICSFLMGVGNFLSWSGLLRYLSFFEKYNLLLVTLRKSFIHVTRFMLCTMLIYCGFCFCGWVIFGPYHMKFRHLSTTTECLFSLINGDDMFETFSLLKSDSLAIWWFSRIYLYLFVSLFIYVVLSLFIALIMDAYDVIKTYSDKGFPKTRLQSFYMDGDISLLGIA